MDNVYSYIQELEERIKYIDDSRTLELIKRLIEERNCLAKIANFDSLTELNNRRVLGNIHACSALAMCDIDDFKEINDFYGHNIGDEVIRNVAQIIKSCVRDTDYVCRYGGDEFLLAFINCPSNVVSDRLEQIRKLVSQYLPIDDSNINITMSFGFIVSDSYEKLDDLVKKADKALYESKKRGKNQITSYSEINSFQNIKKIN